jgi:hypothetical protein
MTGYANPHGVPEAHDRIQIPPVGVANWSENINLAVHGGRADDVGVYAHLSRMPDPQLWEAVICVYLPHGDLLVSRGFGRSSSPDRAEGGGLRWQVAEPLVRWTQRFDGMVRRIRRRDPTTGFVPDGPTELLTMDLEVDAAGPVWSLAHALGGPHSEQSFGSLHLQQAVRVRGRVRTVDGEYQVDNIAVRDHSAGARDYAHLLGDHWATCGFPDGRVLSALYLWQTRGAPSLATGFLVDNGELHPIDNVEVQPLGTAAGHPHQVDMRFDAPAGPTSVEITLRNSMVFTLYEPIGMPLGTNGNGLITVQGPAHYQWNGDHAFGWLERCNRIGASHAS